MYFKYSLTSNPNSITSVVYFYNWRNNTSQTTGDLQKELSIWYMQLVYLWVQYTAVRSSHFHTNIMPKIIIKVSLPWPKASQAFLLGIWTSLIWKYQHSQSTQPPSHMTFMGRPSSLTHNNYDPSILSHTQQLRPIHPPSHMTL